MTEHKEDYLRINGKQSVRLEKGTIAFKKYFKQLPVPFKIYADLECDLESVETYEGSYSKKDPDHIPCSFAYHFVCVDDKYSKPIVVYRGENAAYELFKTILKEYGYCKKVMKKFFNKNLIMSEEKKKQLQSINICWICEKLIDDDDEKVRDCCHITRKIRGTAHWSCNINLQLTKNVPVIFHSLRAYNSHLIFCDLKNLDVKIDLIPNRVEEYVFFFNLKLSLY